MGIPIHILFLESIWIFIREKKNWNHATFSAITRKILRCDMESCYKNISKIRNVAFICKNFQIFFRKRKKELKKFMWILKNQ